MSKTTKSLNHYDCTKEMLPIRDALDVLSGKWKMMILISIMNGNSRFKEIERSIPGITSKVLAKELKDLEEHLLLKRTVYDDYPVSIEYTVTEYSKTLQEVMMALHKWGTNHRKKIKSKK
jgi:hypothetical protein